MQTNELLLLAPRRVRWFGRANFGSISKLWRVL